jgi:hypothetical protein
MTEVSITDFQGVSAKFALGSPLTLISGGNGVGKSRIARSRRRAPGRPSRRLKITPWS